MSAQDNECTSHFL